MHKSTFNYPRVSASQDSQPQPVLRRHNSSDPVLPVELVWEILKWLPVKSLMRFKSVSRTWRSVILDPSFARAYRGGFRGLLVAEPSRRRLTTERYFFYINLDGDGPTAEISHHSTVVGMGTQRRMGHTNIVDGLVCFYFGNYSCLYNIATRETLQLPFSWHDDVTCNYHFGFDPVNKVYKLLKMSPFYEGYDADKCNPEDQAVFVSYFKCEILTVGVDSSWRIIDSLPPMKIVSRSQCFDGVLYWMEPRDDEEITKSVISFHLNEEKFHLVPTPTDSKHFYLPNFGPSLALIISAGYPKFWRETIFYYQFGKGWDEQKIDFPAPKRYFLQGILPNGKVVLVRERDCCSLGISAPIDLYDPAKMDLQEKVIHIPPPILSLFRKADNFYVVDDNSWNHEENIIPLSCLTSSCTYNRL